MHGDDWPAFKKAVTTTQGLEATGLVGADEAEGLRAVGEQFSIRLTPAVLDSIATAERDDPVYAQYVPDRLELVAHAQELSDPIGDDVFEKVKGITHRYPDRLLLKPTHTCQVYCRFCFRREKVGKAEETLSGDELDAALGYIRDHKEIFEVILSGGDPLILSDRRIAVLMRGLGAIAHVGSIRIHTRVPLVDPARIGDDLIAALRSSGKAVSLVIHVNHERELQAPVLAAISRLVDAGVPLFSQSVLLRGINDDAAVLADLFRALVRNRVKPYYLHHLDKARGVNHFRVSLERGQALMRALRGHVSGLCLPTYVLDIPGGYGKVPIGPSYVARRQDGSYVVTDYLGNMHDYAELG
ncbi:lysine-2,3-aminomutase-like protein [Martelella alba]|uniref:Lysine-2,3-aminomutase-like protein n=1 Tax=Martelella alba TaxID=2590451 RepID=A0A506UI56_9HYPH|nr:lysine-2,3-aminomutase-like protein [Martelella alba]TPW32992.1 lysine-2,3-aminomutase-like protein [Martelella alba]